MLLQSAVLHDCKHVFRQTAAVIGLAGGEILDHAGEEVDAYLIALIELVGVRKVDDGRPTLMQFLKKIRAKSFAMTAPTPA